MNTIKILLLLPLDKGRIKLEMSEKSKAGAKKKRQEGGEEPEPGAAEQAAEKKKRAEQERRRPSPVKRSIRIGDAQAAAMRVAEDAGGGVEDKSRVANVRPRGAP